MAGKDFTVRHAPPSGSARGVRRSRTNQFYEKLLVTVRPRQLYRLHSPPEIDALIDRQMGGESETRAKRQRNGGQIERKLIEEAVRPIIFFIETGHCLAAESQGMTLMKK